jgi:pyridoxal phosphate-dependent aminotransferase EpsN
VSERIYLSPPDVGSEERRLLLDAFDSGWIAPLGPHVDAFEHEIASLTGRKYAVATSSGTAALHLALRFFGVTKGSRVLTSSLTFAATANAMLYEGATPVFLDSEAQSWNMDPALLDRVLEEECRAGRRPSAIVPVDLYGQCSNYSTICEIAARYEIPVIVDAAESLGARFDSAPAGSGGQAAILSFNGNKIITTSGGGMVVTNDRQLADKVRFWATQAKDPGPHYQHSELGYNYRLSNLLAALGRGQLRSLDEKVERRRQHNEAYRAALASQVGVRFMPEAPLCRSTFWLSALTIDPEVAGGSRDEVIAALAAANIEARPVWKPMHLQPLYSDCQMHGGAVAERLFEQGICLPSGSSLSDDSRARVIETILRVLG